MPGSVRIEGTIRLPDGRRLGFTEFGVASGPVVLWFHGTPGSSHQVPPAARTVAAERGIRLIGVERPGYGRSTPYVHPSVRDFADDIEALVHALGIDRFAIAGLSGGGAYALGCAHRLPDRVVAVALLGGVAPAIGVEGMGGGLVSVAVRSSPLLPVLREPVAWILGGAVRSMAPLAQQLAPYAVRLLLPPEDTAVLDDSTLRRIFVSDAMRASRRWFGGPLYDATLFAKPWGFSLRDVAVPVRLWHGDADRIVPLAHATHVASLLPDALLTVKPGGGHLVSLAVADEVLQALLDLWPSPDTSTDAERAS
jgi:pimeloyl-ACP methyl ester carboxylesterase